MSKHALQNLPVADPHLEHSDFPARSHTSLGIDELGTTEKECAL